MTDKTTALIDAVRRAGRIGNILSRAYAGNAGKYGKELMTLCDKALAAFEQPAIREMTVDEVVGILHPFFYQHDRSWVNIEDAAKSLAKLGAIKIIDA